MALVLTLPEGPSVVAVAPGETSAPVSWLASAVDALDGPLVSTCTPAGISGATALTGHGTSSCVVQDRVVRCLATTPTWQPFL
jgi:hypothetical protein